MISISRKEQGVAIKLAPQPEHAFEIKKVIKRQLEHLEDLGAVVINTESQRHLPQGMKDCPDYIIVYKGNTYFVERKILKDCYSEGQWQMREDLIKNDATHMTLTEKNMDKLVEAIAGLHTTSWCNAYFQPEPKHHPREQRKRKRQ